MATANVTGTRSGTNWTISVGAANLDPLVGVKDFVVLHNGVVVPNTDYVKTTSTVLTYVGAALPTDTVVEVRRKTPSSIIQPVSYQSRLSSDLWNRELDRKTRWQEEADLNGAGPTAGGTLPAPRNEPYGPVWNDDTVYPPSRDVLYDKLETLAPLASPSLTGVPTAPDTTVGTNTGQVVNTRSLQNELLLKAPLSSPGFTGTPTTPTPAVATDNTTIANTAFVKDVLTSSPTINAPVITGGSASNFSLTGNPTAPTQALDANNTRVANMAALFQAIRGTSQLIVAGTTRIMFGSSVVNTDVSANARVNYPAAFSGNAYTVIAMNGDAAQGSLLLSAFGVYDSTGFFVNVRTNTDAGFFSSTLRINWVAFGPN